MRSAGVTPSAKLTFAFSVAKLTVAVTPSSRLSFFSMRAAQEAQVMPPITSSVVCGGAPVMLIARSARGQRVAGLVDGGGDRVVVHRGLAGHGQRAGLEVDLDVGDAGDGADLLADRADAVGAGHAGDGVRGGAHGFLSGFRTGRAARWRRPPRGPSRRP